MEHEIKLGVSDLSQVRAALAARGGRCTQARARERNWVLDDAAGSLVARGLLLRVREVAGRGRLTFKGAASYRDGVKTREELETAIGEPAMLLAVLGRLGFSVVRRYEKEREEWELAGVTAALDETPMGCFVELEGPPDELRPLAVELGLDPGEALPGSYLELWRRHRERHPEATVDMVFP